MYRKQCTLSLLIFISLMYECSAQQSITVDVFSTVNPSLGQSIKVHNSYFQDVVSPYWYDYNFNDISYDAPQLYPSSCVDYWPGFASPAQCIWGSDATQGSACGVRHKFRLPYGTLSVNPILYISVDDDLAHSNPVVYINSIPIAVPEQPGQQDDVIITAIPKSLFNTDGDNILCMVAYDKSCCARMLRYHLKIEMDGLPDPPPAPASCYYVDRECFQRGSFQPIIGLNLQLTAASSVVPYQQTVPSIVSGWFEYDGGSSATWTHRPIASIAPDRLDCAITNAGADEVTRASVCDLLMQCDRIDETACWPDPCLPFPDAVSCGLGYRPYITSLVQPVIGSGADASGPEYGLFLEYCFMHMGPSGTLSTTACGSMVSVIPYESGAQGAVVYAEFQDVLDHQNPQSTFLRPPVRVTNVAVPITTIGESYHICARSEYSIVYNSGTGLWDIEVAGEGEIRWGNHVESIQLGNYHVSLPYPVHISIRRGLYNYQGRALFQHVESGY